MQNKKQIAIIGAGWAGIAAAITAAQNGQKVHIYEAAKQAGGRARGVEYAHPSINRGKSIMLDSGQHILIGAYTNSLKMIKTVGIQINQAFQQIPLTLTYPDGRGLKLPKTNIIIRPPLNIAIGIINNKNWTIKEKIALIKATTKWQKNNFTCEANQTVEEISQEIPEKIKKELIEPLCVSALNTKINQASGQVFLKVLKDSLFSNQSIINPSDLLLPKLDLGTIFAQSGANWLEKQKLAKIKYGSNINEIQNNQGKWQINKEEYDQVIIATNTNSAINILQNIKEGEIKNTQDKEKIQNWITKAKQIKYNQITTVYAKSEEEINQKSPMTLLKADEQNPAQVLFDLYKISSDISKKNLLAFVVSASQGTREEIQEKITKQAKNQLQIKITPLLTLTDKRATFTCTPQTQTARPPITITKTLKACGDYTQGLYPATLEAAVNSGINAAIECLKD